MSEKCLLIRTKDGKEFLTFMKNLPYLIEFAKTFHAEIFTTTVGKSQKIFELKPLTMAICNPVYKGNIQCNSSSLKRLFPEPSKGRKNIIKEASKIRAHVKKLFLSGKPVSLKELKEKYQSLNLTDACLCNHISIVKKELIEEGLNVKKIKAGTYCLSE